MKKIKKGRPFKLTQSQKRVLNMFEVGKKDNVTVLDKRLIRPYDKLTKKGILQKLNDGRTFVEGVNFMKAKQQLINKDYRG